MLQSKDLRIGNYIMQGEKITCVEKLSRSIDDWDRTNGKRTPDACEKAPDATAMFTYNELKHAIAMARGLPHFSIKHIVDYQIYLKKSQNAI